MDVELRSLRDVLNDNTSKVIVDNKRVYDKIIQFTEHFLPQFKHLIELYEKKEPLFDMYDLDLEISRSLHRKIWLKSGGYIVIDEAEALVVVDVNTGRFVGKRDLEDTILKTNLEAIKEIAHQLRIRNCGGIIILDLIDMESPINRERVLNHLEEELKKDIVKTSIISMSALGLVEMTRKRTRPSLVSSLCEPCPYCEGKSYVKQKTTVSNEIFRAIEREAERFTKQDVLIVHCRPEVADWIYEEESETLEYAENKLGNAVVFKIELSYHIEQFEVKKLKKELIDVEISS
jgi:ribonuclease G